MPMPPRRRRAPRATTVPLLAFAVVAALVGLLGAPAPSAAEWLVLRDGVRLEIRGEPRVETRRVVFTLRDGTLSALPLAEVDLDATAEANRPRPEPAPPAPTPPPAPIARLTDADFDRDSGDTRPTIVLFSASSSSWCEKARKALAASGARFVELDIENDEEAARVYTEIGLPGVVPVIVFGTEVVVGFDKESIDHVIASWREVEAAATADDSPR